MINETRLLKQFFDLVEIASPPLEEAPVVKYITKQLDTLGIDYYIDDTAHKINGNTGNIICSIPGNQQQATPVMFLAHLDTVKPCKGIKAQIEKGVITSAGQTILSADDRVGISTILEAVKKLQENNIEHGDIEMVFTVAEEIGLKGAKNLDLSKLKSKIAFVLDCAKAKPGKIVTHTPTAIFFEIKCIGKSAHAATAPEKGIHAIHFAAKAISTLDMGNVDEDTILNIGTINGGHAINVVPNEVIMQGEVRGFDDAKLKNHLTRIENSFNKYAKEFGGTVEINISKKYNGFKLNETDEVIQIASQAFRNIGLNPEPIKYIGGSDANILNERGIPTANLGLGISNAHSVEESTKVEYMVKMTEAVLEIIKVLSNKE